MINIADIFESIVGEGTHIGEHAIFIRFHGCRTNCVFCDTPDAKHIEGAKLERTVSDLVLDVHKRREASGKALNIIVITGGEPTEQSGQLDLLVRELAVRQYNVHLETNGTGKALNYSLFDHVCVSPKGSNLALDKLTQAKDLEFKLLYDVKDHTGSMGFINGVKQLLMQRLNYLPRITIQLLDRKYSAGEMLVHYKKMAETPELVPYRILPQLHKLTGVK